MTLSDKRDFMLNVFKTQFTGIPEDLKELKARQCLAFSIKLQKTVFSELTPQELKQLTKELENEK